MFANIIKYNQKFLIKGYLKFIFKFNKKENKPIKLYKNTAYVSEPTKWLRGLSDEEAII